MDLEDQQIALAQVHQTDFRSANLWELVGQHLQPGSVLDVGCGAGGMVAWMLEHGHDVRGTDVSIPIIDAAKAFLESRGHDPGRVTQDDAFALAARGHTVDNVLSMDVLEHVEDDRALFATLVSLTRPGGRLLVTVPAMQLLYGDRDRRIGHYRRYNRSMLRALTEGHDLEIETLRYWNILGVGPTYLSNRLRGRSIDESFRYGTPTRRQRVLRRGLHAWFQHIENRIQPPMGLTLFLSARRR